MLAKQRLGVARVLIFPPLREPQESLTSLEPSIERFRAISGPGRSRQPLPGFRFSSFFSRPRLEARPAIRGDHRRGTSDRANFHPTHIVYHETPKRVKKRIVTQSKACVRLCCRKLRFVVHARKRVPWTRNTTFLGNG